MPQEEQRTNTSEKINKIFPKPQNERQLKLILIKTTILLKFINFNK